jgi:hypothetical protein
MLETKAPPPAAVAAHNPPMAGGEARLLAAITAARARQGRTAGQSEGASAH